MWKTYNEKNIPEKGYFPLDSKRNLKKRFLSEIWDKFIKYHRKNFMEQPTYKVKKI